MPGWEHAALGRPPALVRPPWGAALGGVPAATGGPCRPPGLRSPAGWVGGGCLGTQQPEWGLLRPLRTYPPRAGVPPRG